MLPAILSFLRLQAEFVGAISMLYDRNVDRVIAINNLQAPTTMHGNERSVNTEMQKLLVIAKPNRTIMI